MSELDRSRVIELLERLGAEDDEAVLASARELNAYVSAAGASWDDLLEPDLDEDEDYEEDEDADEDEDAEADEPADAEPEAAREDPLPADLEEDGKLIDKLLAHKGISSETRAELSGLKEDMAGGEFSAMDSRYVRALARRLGV